MIFLKRRALMTRFSFNYKTASGIGSLVLEKCSETFFKQFKLLGNSYQETTTGAQLFDITKIQSGGTETESINIEGNKILVTAGHYSSAVFPIGDMLLKDYCADLQVGEFYTLNFKTTGNPKQIYLEKAGIGWTSGTSKEMTEEMMQSRVAFYASGTNSKAEITEFMLNKGSTALPYEPYTGGKPSPSPEFPQEIKSVGEYNSDTGKYDVDVKVTGKNLFDISKLKVGLVQGDGSINENSNIYRTIILDIKKSGKYLIFFKSNNDYNRLYFTTMYSNGKLTKPYLSVFAEKNTFIVLEKGINILSFKARKNDTDVQFVCDSDIMISYDINNVDYEPYKEPQTIKLSLDQPLRGIGKYKDEVTKDGIVRRIKQIVWNGSENWNLSNSNLVQTNKFYLSKVNDAYSAYRKISSLVDALPFVADENSDELGQRFYLGNPMINLDKQKIPDVDTLKQWLSENPMTVQYALAEPITEPLPEETKIALESLYTNEGTTVIAVDGGEVEAGIEVEYAVKE